MQSNRFRLGTGLILASALCAGLAAQTPPGQKPESAQPQQPQRASSGQQPDFRVSIDLVNMDAIVRNGQDVFVADLTKDDFEVFEDGVKQEVSAFTLVH